ncbi:MAG TPA: FAD:protein FMN transferase [Candidatus Binatia bacterium]|jgi:thiamine biosynthesis lipoprotein|nr:FAD:protein FMN transferase [Candidatus Binatia bacterium]
MGAVTLARHAMATRFEIVLHGENAVSLRAAGEEALQEVERLEAQLSLFKPTSEIAHLNARAANEPVRVTATLFGLLQQAKRLSEETGGAFDITVAPLVRCWGFMGGSGTLPKPEDVAEARDRVGMHLVQLCAEDCTVRFARPGVMLDLGAIGKGYAIERAAELLREAGVISALIHGGTSTVYALGHPPESEYWKVGIEKPESRRAGAGVGGKRQASADEPAGVLALTGGDRRNADADLLTTIPLRDEALSVSAVWGKFFQAEGKTFGHIIDPRTGQPAAAAVLTAVVLPSATETDALSTALLTLGSAGHEQIAGLRPGIRTLLVEAESSAFRVESRNMPIAADCAKEARQEKSKTGI